MFRTATGTKLSGARDRQVVFEIDGYAADTGVAWSVIAAGSAHEIESAIERSDAQDLPLFPGTSRRSPISCASSWTRSPGGGSAPLRRARRLPPWRAVMNSNGPQTGLPDADDLVVAIVGPAPWPSPLLQRDAQFVDDGHGVLCSSDTRKLAAYLEDGRSPPAFEEAGPRRNLAYKPGDITAAMVTCGGLCPGLNDVLRSLTLTLHHGYGVRRVLGYRYGFAGLADPAFAPLELTADVVTDVHAYGGSILASSRGPHDPAMIVDTLARDGVSVLFCIGGDGTLRGASAIAAECLRRGLRIAVVGVPKTIDNDLHWVERSLGSPRRWRQQPARSSPPTLKHAGRCAGSAWSS